MNAHRNTSSNASSKSSGAMKLQSHIKAGVYVSIYTGGMYSGSSYYVDHPGTM